MEMVEDLRLFDRVMAEFRKEWNPETLKDTIDNRWDHVLVQAFFLNLGKKLGFEVGCEKFRKWDVAWVKGENHVQVEIELRSQAPITKAFSKISRTFDAFCERYRRTDTQWGFYGILVLNDCLVDIEGFEDFFSQVILNPERMAREVFYPEYKALDLLAIDIERKRYRYAKVGPGRNYQIIYTRSF